MKRNFILSVVIAYSALFFACEEDAIPVPMPPPPPSAQTTDDVELLPPPSDNAPSNNAPSNNTPSNNIASPAPSEMKRMAPSFIEESDGFEGSSEQLKSGRYTIQVVLFPSETSAKKLVRKMEENGIRAYYAKVSNPDSLYGTYYRVRVGYFNEKSTAKAFAKNRLEPLGYAWWVDNTRNDNVPKPGGGGVVSAPAPSKPATVALDPELERAKQEYKEFAKAAAAEKEAKQRQQAPPPPTAKAPPPPPPPAKAKAKAVVQEETTGEMEIDNRGKVRVRKKKK